MNFGSSNGTVPASLRLSPAIAFMSSSESVKSKSWKFSSIRARCVDFGITAIPRCRSHRSATWATVFPWASAIEASVGFVKKPSADCASGLHAVIGIET